MLPTLPLRSGSPFQASTRLANARSTGSALAPRLYSTSCRQAAMATTYAQAARLRLRRTCPPGTRIASVRKIHGSSVYGYPTKEAQDKDSLSPRSTEYSKSGSDDTAAATSDAAFDPNTTSPESEQSSAGREAEPATGGKEGNPLDVSPSNQEVSKPRSSTEGGAESSSGESNQSSSGRKRTSGAGGAPKSGGGQHGG